MKTTELRSMTNDELSSKLNELKQELFNLRFSHATGQLSNPMSLVITKKDIAKVKTIQKQREISEANSSKA